MFRLPTKTSVSDLPPRVQNEVSRREVSSERLISWVQLSLISFLALLYSIAPRAGGAAGFNFLPLAIWAYFAFTLCRLYLSYRTELPNWYLFMSIGVDIFLLLAIIFSFHIQYDQHPTFYLKAPTLTYVFLFIALRALRFDPKHIIVTGIVGALGWLSLVAYAIFFDPNNIRITRNYVEYLTSNTLLIGAELDKTIVILSVTVVLGVALYRVKVMFFEAIRDHTAAKDLKRFFAPEVAQSITTAEEELSAGTGSVRESAILMVDIRSFTSTAAKLQPEKVMKILSSYQGIVMPIVERNGGRVDKFLGDGILATYGAVSDSDTFAADALRTAQEIAIAVNESDEEFQMQGWPGEFKIGVSVASGPVTVGVVGTGNRLEFTVIGDSVNLAVKLDKTNKVLNTSSITTSDCLVKAKSQGFDDRKVKVIPNVEVEGAGNRMDIVNLLP